MAPPRTLRIVAYAVDGSGVGHLTRLIGIGRWLRRYAAHARARIEIWFLTTSEADGLLFSEGMASFKLPSKTAVAEAGVDKLAYLALAKQWVWHSLGLLRPSLLLVDTFPRGSFGELLPALDLVEHRVFVYRPIKESLAVRADFQAMLPLYDLILVPEDEGTVTLRLPEGLRTPVHFTGPMGCRERAELLDRAEARARLGVGEGKLAIYVSAGGGGDPAAERQIRMAIAALADEATHLVIGAGPLYRSARRHGPGITWLCGENAAELMAGFDGAVAAAGYNTFFELMHAGVPTLFWPQPKVADEQARRAERAAAAGAGYLLEENPSIDNLRQAAALWRNPETRARASAAAASLVPRNGAARAAAEILRLLLPDAEVDAAEEAVTGDLLRATAELGLDIGALFDLMHAFAPSESGGGDDDPGAVSRSAVALMRHARDAGIPLPAAQRVATLLSRKLAIATPGERARLARDLLDGLLPFEDWAGACNFLKVFGVEKQLSGQRFVEGLLALLRRLRERDEDLYRGIARLSAAQGTGPEPASQEEMLRLAMESP